MMYMNVVSCTCTCMCCWESGVLVCSLLFSSETPADFFFGTEGTLAHNTMNSSFAYRIHF